jgi:3-deoxy-D-manno-octulosonate 8-phosphate phosphatase KdsC-like HAD superfamily phosphatase
MSNMSSPTLNLRAQAWCPWTAKDKETLEKVQRRRITIVSGLESQSYEERLEELGMTMLEEWRHQLDIAQSKIKRT